MKLKNERFGPPLVRFSNAGRNLGVRAAEEAARQHQIGESKQRIQLRGVFGQAAIPVLAMAG